MESLVGLRNCVLVGWTYLRVLRVSVAPAIHRPGLLDRNDPLKRHLMVLWVVVTVLRDKAIELACTHATQLPLHSFRVVCTARCESTDRWPLVARRSADAANGGSGW